VYICCIKNVSVWPMSNVCAYFHRIIVCVSAGARLSAVLMSEIESRTSDQPCLFGRELRRIADNFDGQVRRRVGGRRSSCCAVVPPSGATLSMMMSIGRITEILRRVLGLLDIRSSLDVISDTDVAASSLIYAAVRRL